MVCAVFVSVEPADREEAGSGDWRFCVILISPPLIWQWQVLQAGSEILANVLKLGNRSAV